jgi:hypothetical protein
MSQPDRADDNKILPASPTPKQVCIISSDPLRAFIGALSPTLRAMDELTIIVDRRRADSENGAARPAIERRHHPWVDTKVNTDGFAIVSLSTTEALPWIDHVVEQQSADDDAEVDERELLRIVELKRRRKARIGPRVRMAAMVGAFGVLVVFFVQMTAGKSLVNRAQPLASATLERNSEPWIEAQPASVREAPVPPRPARPPAAAPEAARPTASSSPPSVRPASLSASAVDPTRPSEGSLPRRAPTGPTPGKVARLSSAPRQPIAGDREAPIEALASRVTSDVNMAGGEAKRQFHELQSKTMETFVELRRIWNAAAQAFSDKDIGTTRGEAAARSRW